MKDLHSHILYGIDDGSKDLDVSLDILRDAYKNGVTDILVTPHYIEDSKFIWAEEEEELRYTSIGSVIGTHAGPGAIAVAFFKK